MESTNGVYVVCIIIILSLVYMFVISSKKKRQLPPGPKGQFFIGNLFQLDQKSPHQTLEKWAKEYGDIYSVKLLGKTRVVISGDELIKEVCIGNADAFSDRPYFTRMDLMQKGGFTLGFRNASEKWMKVKKAVMTSLKAYGEGLERIESLTLGAARGLIDTIDSHEGAPCDILNPIKILMAKIVYTLLFAKAMPEKTALAFVETEDQAIGLVAVGGRGTELDVFPWLKYVRGSIVKEFEEISSRIKEIMKPDIEGKEHDLEKQSIYSALLKFNDANEQDQLTQHDLSVCTSDIIFAGVSTSSSAMYSLLAFSITHPDVGLKIQAEIDDVIGSRVPRLEDRKDMHYVNAVILEVLRLISHLPLSLPHATAREVDIGGYTLPKGQEVWVNLWSLHHDERYWEEPDKFRPDRFLNPDGTLVPPGHPNRRRLMVFGAGRRVCIGEAMAKSRLFILTCLLFQRYNMLPVDESHPISDPRKFKPGIVLRPDDYKLHFVARDTNIVW